MPRGIVHSSRSDSSWAQVIGGSNAVISEPDTSWWPYVLILNEVAALLGVTPDAVRRRVSEKSMCPRPFSAGRWSVRM
jgi:hypothetical protein